MNIKQATRLDAIKEYYFSKKLKEIAQLKAAGKNIINLGIGNPDLPPSEMARKELEKSCWENTTHGYQSYRGIPELRKAMADWYEKYYQVHVNSNHEILPLMGAKEGIMHLAMSFLEKGDEVLSPNPGYPAYRTASMLAGAKVIDYHLKASNGWLPDLEKLEQQDLSKVKIMWINYPNMPTGAKAPLAFYNNLITFAKRNQILIINDNPYSFILNNPTSLLAIEGAKEVAMELNSLSKSHNMAGWRVGMLLGKKEWIDIVLKFKSNMDSGMFLPVQRGAIAALKNPPSWYTELNKIYKKRQSMVFEILEKLGCTFQKNQGGMFVWAKVSSNYPDGYALSDEVLKEHHIFITPGGIFGSEGNEYVRISLCNTMDVLEKVLNQLRIVKLRITN